jgi:hypothetical protein
MFPLVACSLPVYFVYVFPVYFVLAGLPAWLLDLNTHLHFHQKKKKTLILHLYDTAKSSS